MDKLNKRRDDQLKKGPPYIITTEQCCKRHVKSWLERNPQWDRHPQQIKALYLKGSPLDPR